jgi:hypothetical protein
MERIHTCARVSNPESCFYSTEPIAYSYALTAYLAAQRTRAKHDRRRQKVAYIRVE